MFVCGYSGGNLGSKLIDEYIMQILCANFSYTSTSSFYLIITYFFFSKKFFCLNTLIAENLISDS